MSSFIPYSSHLIDDNDIREVLNTLQSDFITQGPLVAEFETALANYCGAKHAVVFSSGTAALHGAYTALGISMGDEIITSPITFAATANAALYLGAKPVFVDIEPETGNIDPDLVERAITSRTKAIVPIHYAGHPADMDPILEIARRKGIKIVEDACHALGASYKGKKIGSISDMTVFSFHPAKPITTGEGGAVLTEDSDMREKLVAFREHGITKDKIKFKSEPHGGWYYEMQSLGFNYRLTDIQCALGNSQLKKLDSFITRKRQLVQTYHNALEGNLFFDLPVEKPYAYSSWHLFPIRFKDNYVDGKKEIFDRLRDCGLGVQVHYIPVYMHPYYKELGYNNKICPKAEMFYRRELSLPLHQGMSEADAERVISEVNKCLQ